MVSAELCLDPCCTHCLGLQIATSVSCALLLQLMSEIDCMLPRQAASSVLVVSSFVRTCQPYH